MQGAALEQECKFIIDTGTSILTGPSKVIDPLLATIGNVSADCSNVPDLATMTFTLVVSKIA